MNTSFKYVIMFLVIISGLRLLLINDEKAAGLMDKPYNNLLISYCWFPITNCVSRRDCSFNGI